MDAEEARDQLRSALEQTEYARLRVAETSGHEKEQEREIYDDSIEYLAEQIIESFENVIGDIGDIIDGRAVERIARCVLKEIDKLTKR